MGLPRPLNARVQPLAEERDEAKKRTRASNVVATMAHHKALAQTCGAFCHTILHGTETPRRQRELLILRTGWNCQAEYEFGQHTLMGREAGLTDAEIFAVTRPLSTHRWSDEDRALLQMADDLRADFCITDGTWSALISYWSTPEIIEFVYTVLGYFVISGFLNTLGVELDEGVPGWPDPPL